MKIAATGFVLGMAVTGLLWYFVDFVRKDKFDEFWDGSHLGINVGIGIVGGLILINFVVTNFDRFINKKF